MICKLLKLEIELIVTLYEEDIRKHLTPVLKSLFDNKISQKF